MVNFTKDYIIDLEKAGLDELFIFNIINLKK